jgi:hypothetical protein
MKNWLRLQLQQESGYAFVIPSLFQQICPTGVKAKIQQKRGGDNFSCQNKTGDENLGRMLIHPVSGVSWQGRRRIWPNGHNITSETE